jgi:hypothetical protein
VIRDFSVENFRAFEHPASLSLAPLTCLVGRNSSGKSSLIHALLLIRQSIEQRAVGSRIPQLNLSGSLIDVGSYSDLVFQHDESRPITFNFEIDLEPLEIIAALPSKKTPVPVQSYRVPLVPIEVPRPPTMRYGAGGIRGMGPRRRPEREVRKAVSVSMSFLPEPPFGPTLNKLFIEIEGIGNVTFTRTVKRRRVQHWRAYAQGLPSKVLSIFFPQWSFLPIVGVREVKFAKASSGNQSETNAFVWYCYRAFRDIDLFLSDLRLVGPFRTPPARRYSFTGLAAADAGPSGERAVDLLITEKLVRTPGQPLSNAVSYWMKRLGLARRVKVRDVAKRSNIFELTVSGVGPARVANFADVGFGVSQVLPVIVQGFLVPRGGTYVVQQPELHLHPDAQAGLADFFLYLASRGVRLIIETHSEYLLVRLRRRLAEGIRAVVIGLPTEELTKPIALKKESVSIVYVGNEAGSAQTQRLIIDDSFQFDDLPEGFMSQATDDRLALMKSLRRTKK